MNNKREQLELNEFQEFLNSEPSTPGSATTQNILKIASFHQKKYRAVVLVKLLSIHLIMSTLSLYICHQFDMNPFNSAISLSHYFMMFGHHTCMLFCGSLFIGGSFLAARALLNRHEFQIIKNSLPLQLFILCSLSLAVFATLGAHLTLSITLFWLIGATLGTTVTTLQKVRTPNL
ncbi:MAG: hypothetical protein IT287_08705 [Bdellovibrionaceae bacterium]|nr:hypothetical protein [Pseudobdellovibrionaceae bacterium]